MKQKRELTPARARIRELVELRLRLNIGPFRMAELAGVCQKTLWKFEHGSPIGERSRLRIDDAYEKLQTGSFDSKLFTPVHDAEWLNRQTEAFLRENSLGVVEKDRQAHFVLSYATVLDYGRTLMLAVGKKIPQG